MLPLPPFANKSRERYCVALKTHQVRSRSLSSKKHFFQLVARRKTPPSHDFEPQFQGRQMSLCGITYAAGCFQISKWSFHVKVHNGAHLLLT